MEGPFEMITIEDEERKGKEGVRLGIHVEIAGQAATCPFTAVYHSYEALEAEIRRLKKGLENILQGAKPLLSETGQPAGLNIDADMEPANIWAILSELQEEALFIEHFNQIEESKRREVAEHVLTHCNIFSGKAAVFSSRYDNETAKMK
ncbi:hypothetical protein ACFL9T_01055 [Thermodesulfobacteriota bacterium]